MFKGRIARRAGLVVALAVLTAGATVAFGGLTAPEAEAKARCDMWALADHVDHQGKMYGAGGVNSCTQALTPYVDVYLYRDGKSVGHGRADCRDRPCATSTGSVSIPPGDHSWCTHVIVQIGDPFDGATQREIDCTVT